LRPDFADTSGRKCRRVWLFELSASRIAPPGTTPAPFEIILESPHHAPMDLQRQAFVLALEQILRHYRRMISYAANL